MRTADLTLVHLQGPAPVVSPPLGCLCLIGALEAQGIHVDFRDYQLETSSPFDPDGLVRFLTDDAAPIIGIGGMVNVLPHLVRALRAVREASPTTRIVLGGPGPSSVALPLLESYPVADVIVIGEAEETLPDVVRALRGGGDLSSIPGLVIPTEHGVHRTPPRPRIRDLDALPPPAYDRVDLGRYNGAVPVELARGCPFSCAFCETSTFWGHTMRARSPESVSATIRRLADGGWSRFGFVDDTFGLDPPRSRRLLSFLAAQGVSWTCSTRVERLDEAWIEDLARAGCHGVFLGVESGSPRVLARIGKRGVTAEEVEGKVRLLEGRFDPITASFVWGFPFETLDDLAETLALASSLRAMGAVTPLHLLAPLPSAPLTKEFAHLRRFDPLMVPDLSAVRLDEDTMGLVRGNVDVFSSFYFFDHPTLRLKRALVRRLTSPKAPRP